MKKRMDLKQGELFKERGMGLAADNRQELLSEVRNIAVQIAMETQSPVSSDDVRTRCERIGIDYDALGPAAGSIFKGKAWRFTGERVKSRLVTNHAREIKLWRFVTG